MPKLAKMRNKLYQRWMRIERADIVKDIKETDRKIKERAKPTTPMINPSHHKLAHGKTGEHHEMHMPLEERIQQELVSEEVRRTFIENELRTRRYLLLPQINMWEKDVESWNKELEEWEDTHKTMKVMGIGDADHGGFRWPPQEPSHMPPEFGEHREEGEQQVLDMIRRARAHGWKIAGGKNGGWSEVPKKVIGETLSSTLGALQAQRKGGEDFAPGGDEDHPFGRPSNEDLQSYQVGDFALPNEFRETAPGVNAPEWRVR